MWTEYLLAIVCGNLIYFYLIEPFLLPESWHHQPFRMDAGLLLDFLFCLALLFLIRGFRRGPERPDRKR